METNAEFLTQVQGAVEGALSDRDEKMENICKEINDKLMKNAESIVAFKRRLEREDTSGAKHQLWGTKVKAEAMSNYVIARICKSSKEVVLQELGKDAEEKFHAATDYSLGTGTGLEWARVEYSQVVTDLQTRFGLARKQIQFYTETGKGTRGFDFPVKKGQYSANFMTEIAPARANAVTNSRTLSVKTIDWVPIACYAYITRLARDSDRISIVDSILFDHAQAIARREDWAVYNATALPNATDGGFQGLFDWCPLNGRSTTLPATTVLTWDHLIDMIATFSNVVREDISNISFGMSYETWNYLRKLKDNVGQYYVKHLQDATLPFRNLDGIKIETGATVPSASATQNGCIVLVHNTEAIKVATGGHELTVEDYSLAPQFATGIGAYENFASIIVANHLDNTNPNGSSVRTLCFANASINGGTDAT